jgi:uncharacterized repeat protein (TIGR01451 family)
MFTSTNNPGWVQAGNTLQYLINSTINPGETIDIELRTILQYCEDNSAWRNRSEISNSPPDSDSTPDNNPDNDPQNEDDFDEVLFPVYDLSLNKSILNPSSSYNVGQAVTFQISITNQGNISANNIRITDFLPCGLSFSNVGNMGWTQNGSNLEYVISSLLPKSVTNISLTLTIRSRW